MLCYKHLFRCISHKVVHAIEIGVSFSVHLPFLPSHLSPAPTVAGSADEMSDPTRAESAGSSSHKPVVTAADIKNKTCWICSEDETDSAPSTPPPHVQTLLGGQYFSSLGSERNNKAMDRRRFVHACACTLVAHEGVSHRAQ